MHQQCTWIHDDVFPQQYWVPKFKYAISIGVYFSAMHQAGIIVLNTL